MVWFGIHFCSRNSAAPVFKAPRGAVLVWYKWSRCHDFYQMFLRYCDFSCFQSSSGSSARLVQIATCAAAPVFKAPPTTDHANGAGPRPRPRPCPGGASASECTWSVQRGFGAGALPAGYSSSLIGTWRKATRKGVHSTRRDDHGIHQSLRTADTAWKHRHELLKTH